MQVYVQKSTTTTRPRRPSVVSGGELSHPVAPSSDGILPSAGRRPGAQPAPRTARSIASSNDESCSISSPSHPVEGVAAAAPRGRLSQRAERRPDLLREHRRLLPGGEVAATVGFVEVGEGGI